MNATLKREGVQDVLSDVLSLSLLGVWSLEEAQQAFTRCILNRRGVFRARRARAVAKMATLKNSEFTHPPFLTIAV